MAKQTRGEAFEQGHFCQRKQIRGQIGLLLRHANSSEDVDSGECAMVAGIAAQCQPIALPSCS
jgi:hypothetical protein